MSNLFWTFSRKMRQSKKLMSLSFLRSKQPASNSKTFVSPTRRTKKRKIKDRFCTTSLSKSREERVMLLLEPPALVSRPSWDCFTDSTNLIKGRFLLMGRTSRRWELTTSGPTSLLFRKIASYSTIPSATISHTAVSKTQRSRKLSTNVTKMMTEHQNYTRSSNQPLRRLRSMTLSSKSSWGTKKSWEKEVSSYQVAKNKE